jgi:GNAT superfamily N-acetyltransferase
MTFRELKKTDWQNVESLFGSRGACGGCWCQHWRVPKGGKAWEAVQGEPNRKALKRQVRSGKAEGILAFDGAKPVGWCSFGRRTDFPRTEGMKAYRRDDIDEVWSINCFFIAKGYQGRGLCRQLAEAAIKAIKKRRGKTVEAYPVTLTKDGNKLPPAFSYQGPEKIFRRLGFKEIQRLSQSRPLYRLQL